MELENKIVNLVRNKTLIYSSRILPKLKKDKVRIRIKSVGVCASDIPRAFESMAYKYPLVMGHEFIAKIIDIGSIQPNKIDKVYENFKREVAIMCSLRHPRLIFVYGKHY